ncbi:MAG: flippase [Ignavibacteriales bacterium]|nr:flippase [Ignavibacteriales bacterium]
MKNLENNQPLTFLVVKNTFYNLITQLILMAVVIWSLPNILHGLSKEGFGLLSLIWAVIGYFSLFDFGLSRANTKFLAEAVALDDKLNIRKLVWTSLFITSIIGIVFGIMLISLTPIFVRDIFKVDESLMNIAISSMIASAIGLPFMLLFGSIKGFQMALQRFDLVNIFQSILGVGQWLGAVLLITFGFGIKEIIYLTIGIRILMTIIAFAGLSRLIPHIYDSINIWDKDTIKSILKFGSWLTISQIISPLFLYLDRFLIGILLSLSAVAVYTLPQEAISRFLIIPLSLTTTLFPALSGQSVLNAGGNKVMDIYDKSIKYLFIFLLPIIIFLIVNTQEIINIWIGNGYASESIIIFQILLIGFFFNSLAQIPATTLHALNRPDLTAKFHLIELPILIILNLVLIPIFGIMGAAIAWTVRVVIDAVLLFAGVNRISVKSFEFKSLFINYGRYPFHLIVAFLSLIIFFISSNNLVNAIISVAFLLLYFLTVWYYFLNSQEKENLVLIRSKLFR